MGKGQFSPIEKKQERNGLMGNGKKDKNGDSDKGSLEVEDDYVAPPDGGWGWMVVFSSFLIHVIADGVVYSFGVFLMEFVNYFKSGRGAASWIGSLQPAVTYTVGPLSSALTNHYGCRKVTIVGAVIATVGFVISVWAPDLYYLYFSAGILAGLGFGLIYLPAIVCVAQYFEKKRSFATGLAVCGSGFGTFILAPVTELLVHEFSWRGAMLILGGIILNIIVCGIIFRPLEAGAGSQPKPTAEPENDALLGEAAVDESKLGGNVITIEEVEFSEDKPREKSEGEKLLTAAETYEIINSLQQLNALPSGKVPPLVARSNSESTPQTRNLEPPDNVPTNLQDVKSSDEKGNIPHLVSASQCLTVSQPHDDIASIAFSDGALHKHSPGQQAGTSVQKRRSHRSSESSHGSSTALSPLQRKDIFYSGSLQNIPMYRSQPDVYKTTIIVASSAQEVGGASEKADKKGGAVSDLCAELSSTMKDMLSAKLLKNPVFLMFAFSNFFTSIGFNMPFIFLPDRAKLAGIEEDKAALLLSVIGIANTAGRVIFGFLSDQPWVNRLMLYNTALTICGVATALSPVVGSDYGLLVVYAAIFGVFIGVYVSLTSVVLVDLLGLEYLTNSFGLLLLFQGAATFVGPPIAGWFCDWTGSYDISFIVMGTLIAISGAMLYFLPFVERCHARRVSRESMTHDMELGKHPVIKDGVEIVSIERLSPS